MEVDSTTDREEEIMYERLTFLEAARDGDAFFSLLTSNTSFTRDEQRLLKKACCVMEEANEGIYRDNDAPAFTHPYRTALISRFLAGVRTPNTLISNVVHDLKEDFGDYWCFTRLFNEFNPIIASNVEMSSKIERKLYDGDRHMRDMVFFNSLRIAPPQVVHIKLPDRFDNMLTLPGLEHERQVRILGSTIDFYLPWARKHNVMVQELEWIIMETATRLGVSVLRKVV